MQVECFGAYSRDGRRIQMEIREPPLLSLFYGQEWGNALAHRCGEASAPFATYQVWHQMHACGFAYGRLTHFTVMF